MPLIKKSQFELGKRENSIHIRRCIIYDESTIPLGTKSRGYKQPYRPPCNLQKLGTK